MINISDNYTVFGMHGTAERFSWVAFHIFVLLSSLFGDSLILYASVQEGAIKLNKLIVTVMQYIAVSDLVYTIAGVLPGTIPPMPGS